jgi:hypothetical protein
MHRMPTVFGPSVGPRQGPDGHPYPPGTAGAQQVTVMSFLARSEAEVTEATLATTKNASDFLGQRIIDRLTGWRPCR